jgi:hypothetical protein
MPTQFAKQTISRRTIWALAVITLALAGCASDRQLSDPFAPTRAEPPPKPATPQIDMAGRWLLASADRGQCGMNFTAPVGATSGRIAPEGGCPGRLFTSRQWAFDQGALVFYDHREQEMARLAPSEPAGQFSGNATAGFPVTLTRFAPDAAPSARTR